ncbi:MAG: efflux RND transporter permease subunit [bacterium]
MNLPHFAIKRPVTILMIFLGTIILGFLGLGRLPIELMPNASNRTITIFIGVRGGLPPPEIENQITKIVEEAVATVSHLKNIISTSKKDRSVVTLEFEPGTDMDFAAAEVREKFEKIKNKLPREIEKPIIAKYEESDVPIMIIGLTGSKYTPEMIRRLVDEKIKEQIMQVDGVANIEIGGGRERKILIDLDQVRIQSLHIPIKKVLDVLGKSNLDLLAGEVERTSDKYLFRTKGSFQTVEDIANIHVLVTDDKSIIRLKDIAAVKDSFLDAETYSRLNRRDSVSLYIQKESNANSVKAAEKIKAKIEEFKKELDPDIKLTFVSDQAKFITSSINTVQQSLLIGAFLAAFILYVFLRDLRHTLVIATVIPISVMITFFGMYFAKISLNVMSLMGLALGIGMLLDNSIVVLENIFRLQQPYKEKPGADAQTAQKTSVQGAQEMFLAIFASTITTIVVFLPITFINKQVRILYSDFSFTVIFSLVASLIVAVSLLPLMISWIPIKRSSKTSFADLSFQWEYKIRNLITGLIKKLRPAGKKSNKSVIRTQISPFSKMLLFSIRRRYPIYLVLTVLFAVSMFLFAFKIDKEFMGFAEQNEFTIFVELPSGTKLDISDEIVSEIEKTLNEIPELKKFVKSTQSRVEGWSSKIYVTLVEKKERVRTTGEIITELRPKLKDIGKEHDSFVYFSEPESAKEFIIDVFGYDYNKLADIATSIANQIGGIGGLEDVKLRYRPGRPEARFNISKTKAAYLGFSIRQIAEILHAQVWGMRASFFHTESKEVEIIPRLDEKYRKTVNDLKKLTLFNSKGERIFLDQISDVVYDLSPSEIWRKNKERMIQVSANLEKISISRAAEKAKKILKDFKFPKDYFAQIGGDYEQMMQNEKEFLFAFIISIILVYAVLASLFESYVQPFIILITVPMAGIGVVAIIMLTIKVITVGVFMGMLMLGGVVVNNAIILIDRINQVTRDTQTAISRKQMYKIIITTAQVRLRPILMTSITTLLGLLPMAVYQSEGASLWRPLAITVIGGLSVSTFLTLLAVPGMYLIFEDIKLLIFKKTA